MKILFRFNRQNSLLVSIKRLFTYTSNGRRKQLAALLVLLAISSLSEMISLGAVFPFLGALSNPNLVLSNPAFSPVLQLFKIDNSIQLVSLLTAIFIGTTVLSNCLRIIALQAQVRLSASIGSDFGYQVYEKTLKQSYNFHITHNSSDLMQTLIEDVYRLTQGILIPSLSVVTSSLIVLSLITALIIIDGYIAISAAAIIALVYIIIYQARKKVLRKNSNIIAQAGQQKIKFVQEGLGGIRDVLISNTQDFFLELYIKAERPLRQADATNVLIGQTPKFIVEAVAMSAIALLALGLGRDGNFDQVIPILGSLALGAKRLLPAIQELFSSITKIQSARTPLARVLDGLERTKDPIFALPKPTSALKLKDDVRLDHIWFRYTEDGDWTIRDLSLSITANTTVGFVGSTGSGKTTTTDLILGLLQPQRGTISVDGKPLEGERLRQWQMSVAHVPQSIFLADASIGENIAFAEPKDQIDFDQVRRAAKMAQVDEFIRSLPAGYDTYVGERGVRLSGGQRQRIGIARALYRQASVIIFDEATSALDNATEKEVMSAINSLGKHFTIILIAHRLSTVKQCDTIFELKQGKLIGQGSYQELLSSSSSFREMTLSSK